MQNNSEALALSDPDYVRYADTDFSTAKPVDQIPALARLQAAHAAQGGKSRITIRVDKATLAAFKAHAEASGDNYQTLMNQALAQFVQGQTLADVVRNTIRQELRQA